jgi:magnesium-dependent phosphatase 1
MYELLYFSGGAGAPFSPTDDGNTLLTRKGEPVYLLGNVREVMQELYCNSKWNSVSVGISSRTDQPDWARELLQKFQVDHPLENGEERGSFVLQDVFRNGPIEIASDSKVKHFRRISQATGIALEEMLFFDNEIGNCRDVSEMGVTVAYCPDGVTTAIWEAAVRAFPAAVMVQV